MLSFSLGVLLVRAWESAGWTAFLPTLVLIVTVLTVTVLTFTIRNQRREHLSQLLGAEK